MTYFAHIFRQTIEDRIKQQQECGVFYEDDYNYLQHLKPRTDTQLEPLPSNVTVIETKKPGNKKVQQHCMYEYLFVYIASFRKILKHQDPGQT